MPNSSKLFKDRKEFYDRLKNIPSVEAQLMYWIEAHQHPSHINLMSNQWFEYEGKAVYIRKISDELMGKSVTTLEISNVSVKEELRGKLWFTNFLKILHSLNPWEFTAVASITNPRLEKFLEDSGWIRIENNSQFYISFYKKV